MKYDLNTRIGNIIITGYDPALCYYKMKCGCGTEVTGTVTSVSDKEEQVRNFGTAGCRTCMYKVRRTFLTDKELYQPIYKQYIRSAHKKDQREFSLSYEYALNLFKSNCHYCGAKPSNVIKIGQRIITYSGIDRMEQSIGYLESNTVPCCKICNYAKHTLNYVDFKNHITNIYNNLQRPEHPLVGSSDPKWKDSVSLTEYDMV